ACRTVFGISATKIHKMVQNDEKDCSDFERKICSYFGLNSSAEREYFLEIMCAENSLNYFRKKLTENEPTHSK
ncbi:MAG: hypothetical protein K6G84_02265, partial [Lachnospiraceae bacterium]|nr:hypothetical protein [Lachnospiraceae bacterium]